jgi:hypothetical protein
MNSNLKVILSTIGLAALLVSPAMAKSNARHHNTIHNHAAPFGMYGPNDAYGYPGSSQETISDRWRATHSGSWDATHDPRENPQ